jgi:hypothetical protein
MHHSRAKHIDIQFHFVREHISSNKVEFQYLLEEMIADIFTKGVGKDKFETYRSKLRLVHLK